MRFLFLDDDCKALLTLLCVCSDRDWLRHGHQHRGSDLEVEAEGGLPRPQRLLHLHGQLLQRHRYEHRGIVFLFIITLILFNP